MNPLTEPSPLVLIADDETTTRLVLEAMLSRLDNSGLYGFIAKMPQYGLNKTGHIVLQDHGDQVRFRNLRIR